jgi:SAM-dependent methyltransferase
MIRAVAKAAVQLGFGRAPGGFAAYRALTRGRMGTAATHVDKLARVWPGYVALWQRLGIPLEDRVLWLHDAGATPFLPIAAFLLTGRGAAVTLGHEVMHARYLEHARRGALDAGWPAGAVRGERRLAVEGLRWLTSLDEALAAVGARVYERSTEIGEGSVDLCHSGGALEHESPDELETFLAEQVRVLRPGGVASHVFDHRDHLHHADRALPFLSHLAWPEPLYLGAFGHALGYHSRLSPTDVAARFAAAGLERVAVRRLIYDARSGDRRWVDSEADAIAGAPGIPRERLAARFRAWSDADLRTAAAHYVYARY